MMLEFRWSRSIINQLIATKDTVKRMESVCLRVDTLDLGSDVQCVAEYPMSWVVKLGSQP